MSNGWKEKLLDSASLSKNCIILGTGMELPGGEDGTILIGVEGREFLRCKANGDIFVQGRLTTNDQDTVDSLRDWLQKMMGGDQCQSDGDPCRVLR